MGPKCLTVYSFSSNEYEYERNHLEYIYICVCVCVCTFQVVLNVWHVIHIHIHWKKMNKLFKNTFGPFMNSSSCPCVPMFGWKFTMTLHSSVKPLSHTPLLQIETIIIYLMFSVCIRHTYDRSTSEMAKCITQSCICMMSLTIA